MGANNISIVPKTAWTHRRRFNVTAADDDKRYFENGGDTTDSMSKWDSYDSTPLIVTGAVMAGAPYVAPIKCYLTSYEAIGYSGTADDRPYQIEVYYGTPISIPMQLPLSLLQQFLMVLLHMIQGDSQKDCMKIGERVFCLIKGM